MAVTFVDSGTTAYPTLTTTYVWDVPAGTVEDDFFVIAVTLDDDHGTAVTNNTSGMDLLFPYSWNSGASVSPTVWTWFAPASPPSTVTFSGPANLAASVTWMRFRGVDTDTPLAGGPEVDTSWPLGTSFTAPSLTTTQDGAFVVGGLNVPSGSRTVTFPSGWTNRAVGTERIGALGTLGEIPSAGSVGSAEWSVTGGALRGQPWQVALNPNGESAAPNGTLTYAWLGIPTSGSMTVSAKTANTSSVRLKVGTNSTVTSGVTFSDPVVPDETGYAKITATGLNPDTQYWYQVEMTNADDVATLSAETGPAKTLPTPGGAHSFSFAFGSCHDSQSSNGNAFSRIVNRDPDMFFHLGDFHYADSTSTVRSAHRLHMEGQLDANAWLRTLLSSVPTHYTKSDHDVGGGNGVLPGQWTEPNLDAYKQMVPHLPLEVEDGIYVSFVVGRVRFICTDHRYLRTSTSMMGATQKAWFKAQLLEPEPVKIWVMDSPWVNHDAPEDPVDDDGDKWSDYPDEHEELGDYIAEFAVGQVVGIHGDMHALAADDGSNNDWGGFPTFNAAPFDRNNSVKGGPWSEGVYPPSASGTFRQQYGMVTITDTGDDITVSYVGYDSSNNDQINLDVFVQTTAEIDEGSTSVDVETDVSVVGVMPTATVPEGATSTGTSSTVTVDGETPTATVPDGGTSLTLGTTISLSGTSPTATVPEGSTSVGTSSSVTVDGGDPAATIPKGTTGVAVSSAVSVSASAPPAAARGIRIVDVDGPLFRGVSGVRSTRRPTVQGPRT